MATFFCKKKEKIYICGIYWQGKQVLKAGVKIEFLNSFIELIMILFNLKLIILAWLFFEYIHTEYLEYLILKQIVKQNTYTEEIEKFQMEKSYTTN